MNNAFFSHARWSKIGTSSDRHINSDDPVENAAFAKAICERLKNEFGPTEPPCPIRGTCLEAWVTNSKGQIVYRSSDE